MKKMQKTAHNAVASTFGLYGEEYHPMPKAKIPARGPLLFCKVAPDQWEWIHAEAARLGQTISEYMRRLIAAAKKASGA